MGTPDLTPLRVGLARLGATDLNLLVPLSALLEERSVTRAAARVGLSQPAMSHALRRLRQLLDDRLLVRRAGGMTLTPRAEQLIAPTRAALQQAARALSPVPFDPLTSDRTVTVVLSTSTAFVFAPLLLAAAAREAPRLRFRLRTRTLTAPSVFTDDGVDVVLLPRAIAAPHPRVRLYDDHLVTLASSLVPPDRTPMELLTDEPHIVFDAEDGFEPRGYELLDAHGIHYGVLAEASDFLLVPQLVASTRAVCLHRYQVGRRMSADGTLRMHPFPFDVPLAIDMVWNPWLADDAFRRWLQALLVTAATPLNDVEAVGRA